MCLKGKFLAVILSGGQSRRMDGNDKGFLSIANQNFIRNGSGQTETANTKGCYKYKFQQPKIWPAWSANFKG